MTPGSLTRAELSDAVHREIGLSRAESAQLVENVLDSITDAIDIPDSVKIASYMPAPSFMGAYVGFAPDHD